MVLDSGVENDRNYSNYFCTVYILQTKIIKYLGPEDASSKLCYSAVGYLVPFVIFFNSTFLFMVTDHRGGRGGGDWWLPITGTGHSSR